MKNPSSVNWDCSWCGWVDARVRAIAIILIVLNLAVLSSIPLLSFYCQPVKILSTTKRLWQCVQHLSLASFTGTGGTKLTTILVRRNLVFNA
ncbi:hypothetical protein NDI42_23380 [Funiculus sociatus GB2-C1]|uniref:hypothetical protein n=1 Tax=Trichocoleus sp. FACHB-69 TaxID=2692874 RepID=UPI001685722D|nr:hypothetical protein [Trichocoleus sp. FACHB-69]